MTDAELLRVGAHAIRECIAVVRRAGDEVMAAAAEATLNALLRSTGHASPRDRHTAQTCRECGAACRCGFDGPLVLSSPCCVHGEADCHPRPEGEREPDAVRFALERLLCAHEPDFAHDRDAAVRHGHDVLNSLVRRATPATPAAPEGER